MSWITLTKSRNLDSTSFSARFRALTILLLGSQCFESAIAQNSEWVTVHQNPQNGAPQGQVIASYSGSRFFTDAGDWNGNPVAFWSNGSTLWVTDGFLSRLYAYNPGGPRDKERDFRDFAQTGNRSARGSWSDGKTMWVTDDFQDKLFAYDLNTRERLPDLDIETIVESGNISPTGVWSNGETMWIADDGDDKIYAYEFGTWRHLPEKDINTLKAAGNTGLADIWSDGTTLWVSEVGTWTTWGGWNDGHIFAYDLSSGERLPAKDFDNQLLRDVGIKSPTAIWSNKSLMWIADRPDHRVFIFNLNRELIASTLPTGLPRDESRDVRSLGAAGNVRPSHLWSDGETLWVADNEAQMIFAYDFETNERLPRKNISFGFEPDERQLNPAGLWSDGETIWVLDWYTTRGVAFDLETHERLPERDINTLIDSGNHHPSGMWSNGDVLWVLDSEDKAIYAYDLPNGQRRISQELAQLNEPGNTSPRGFWSDGTTFWVGDWEKEMIFAYRRTDGERTPEKDIKGLFAAGNLSPAGLWSDGDFLWVSDHADSRIYSYPIATDPESEAPNPQDSELSIHFRTTPTKGLTIEFSGILKSASTVLGPFETVDGAVSPFEIGSDAQAQFYIVEQE